MADKIYIAKVVLVTYITYGQIEVDKTRNHLISCWRSNIQIARKDPSLEMNEDNAFHLCESEYDFTAIICSRAFVGSIATRTRMSPSPSGPIVQQSIASE